MEDQGQPPDSHIGLVGIATLVVVTIGAAVFQALERDAALKSRERYEDRLASLVGAGNFSRAQTAVLEEIISHHGDHWCMPHMALSDPWNYKSSLYFTMVLISTVGYGDLAPETPAGKWAAVLVSLVGIPLLLSFTVPLSRRLVDTLTSAARRTYITFAVRRAMDAVEQTRDALLRGKAVRVDYSRRLPNSYGIGLSHEELWKVEFVALLMLLLVILAAIACMVPLLIIVEGWAVDEAACFIWYTLTTIGLGDRTMDLSHPALAVLILVVLVLLGTTAARVLMHSAQRATLYLARTMADGVVSTLSGTDALKHHPRAALGEVLDRMAERRGGVETLPRDVDRLQRFDSKDSLDVQSEPDESCRLLGGREMNWIKRAQGEH